MERHYDARADLTNHKTTMIGLLSSDKRNDAVSYPFVGTYRVRGVCSCHKGDRQGLGLACMGLLKRVLRGPQRIRGDVEWPCYVPRSFLL